MGGVPNYIQPRPSAPDPLRLDFRERAKLMQAPRVAADPNRFIAPGPLRHRFESGSETSRLNLANYRPGDVVETPGATLRIRAKGPPEVRLNPGFENGRAAGAVGPVLMPEGPPGVSLEANIDQARRHLPPWFLNQVPNKRPWDYKQQGPDYEPFGNFNYGAAGRAARLPPPVLRRGAGWAQQQAGTSDPTFGSPWLGSGSLGDDPVDQFWIQQGIRYHDDAR